MNLIRIRDFSSEELDLYVRLSEPQLYHYCEPLSGLFIAESPKIIERALAAGYEPVSFLLEETQLDENTTSLIEKSGRLPVYIASEEVLSQMTGFSLTRGVLCAMRRKPLPPAAELCTHARRIVILEGITNPTNIGAIIRSAAAMDLDAVLLTPDSSDPLYRRAVRVSMGCIFQIPWTFFNKKKDEWPDDGLAMLKSLGFTTAALALTNDAVPLCDPRLSGIEKLAILLGSEGDGLAHQTITSCDITVRIPMKQGVDSLNVAAASAVAFWELRN